MPPPAHSSMPYPRRVKCPIVSLEELRECGWSPEMRLLTILYCLRLSPQNKLYSLWQVVHLSGPRDPLVRSESSARRLRRSPPGLTPIREPIIQGGSQEVSSFLEHHHKPSSTQNAPLSPLVPPLVRGCDHLCGFLKPES